MHTLDVNSSFYRHRSSKLVGSLRWDLAYTRKNYELLKTGLNNVVLPILLIVVNNIEQVVEPESSPQSGVTMLNNIVDIIEQCGQHNIVQYCFQQPVTTYNFWLCRSLVQIKMLAMCIVCSNTFSLPRIHDENIE